MKQKGNKSSVPVSQMISESQTMDTIFQWLQAWSKCNPIPNEIILDDSSALIGACVKAFTNCSSTAKYIEDSYRRLEQSEKRDTCYIRIDTSHFVKILFNLSCFKHTDTRVNFFYIKCLLELKDCSNYVKAKDILSDMIILSLNERDGVTNNGHPTRCESARNRLKKLNQFHLKDNEIEIKDNEKLDACIESSDYSIFKNNLKNEDTESVNTILSSVEKCPRWFYDKIEAEKIIITLSDDADVGNHDNLYYFPGFLVVLSRLMRQFPLWSNVMKTLYNSDVHKPTSSNVESYFKNIKKLLFTICSKSHRLRVDQFIIKHLEFLTGELKIANSNLGVRNNKTTKKSIPKCSRMKKTSKLTSDFTDDSVFSDTPSLIENWRGKGVPKSKKKYPALKPVVLLTNGSRFKVDDNIIIIKNTCALDSVAQALSVAFVDVLNTVVNQIIQNNDHIFCQLIRSICEKKTDEIYNIRSVIAQTYFKSDQKGTTVEIDCQCNVLYIFDQILTDCSLHSADEKQSCTNIDCRTNNVIRKVSVLRVPNTPITNLQEAANSVIDNVDLTACRRSSCNGIKSFELILRDIIAFETSDEFISLDDVPVNLVLNNTNYELISIIEFIPPGFGEMGHYKAHCKRRNSWQCYNDLNNRITKSNKKLIAHCLIYLKI